MTLLRFIAFFSILVYNVQRQGTFGGNGNGNIWVLKAPNEAFSHFFEHKYHILDVERISTFVVGFVTECALRCLRHVSCISFNIEDTTTHARKIRTCELLPKDVYHASHKFQQRKKFHHWSTLVSEAFLCFLHCTLFLKSVKVLFFLIIADPKFYFKLILMFIYL